MKPKSLFIIRMLKRKDMFQKTFFILIMATVLIFISCQSKVATDIPPDLLENKVIPSMDAVSFETTFTDSGAVKYHLKTPRLLVFSEEKIPYREFPEGFLLQEYDNNKKIKSELSANYGKEFMKEGKWLATGNVVMVNNKGDTLRTEELNYIEKEDLIFTDKFVSIKKGDEFITGSGGFKSDAQMTKWSFISTKGHVYMKDQ
jgi:LPS export ABC transporter protein LptC